MIFVTWRAAALDEELSIDEDAVGAGQRIDLDGRLWNHAVEANMDSEPEDLVVVGIGVAGELLAGIHKIPMGVIEVGSGPGGIVSGVKEPF